MRVGRARLADQLEAVGTGALSGVNALPGNAFGNIGQEVGLGAAFQHATQGSLDAITAASGGLNGLAATVGDSLRQYEQQDADAADNLNRAAQN